MLDEGGRGESKGWFFLFLALFFFFNNLNAV